MEIKQGRVGPGLLALLHAPAEHQLRPVPHSADPDLGGPETTRVQRRRGVAQMLRLRVRLRGHGQGGRLSVKEAVCLRCHR